MRANDLTSSDRNEIADGLKQGMLLGAALLALVLPPSGAVSTAAARKSPTATVAPHFAYADFRGEEASAEAQHVAHWAVDSRDHRNMSFVIIDKKNARVYVFDRTGKLKGATPVLIGAAPGDHTVEGIGSRPIHEVRPEERTTPAGRFIAEPGRNASGEDVVWVDYDAAVSMHRVRPTDPKERRLERLASPTSADNRISYGCINVPVDFYESIVRPTFDGRYGVVYVLPEVRPLREVFNSYDLGEKHGKAAPCTSRSCNVSQTTG